MVTITSTVSGLDVKLSVIAVGSWRILISSSIDYNLGVTGYPDYPYYVSDFRGVDNGSVSTTLREGTYVAEIIEKLTFAQDYTMFAVGRPPIYGIPETYVETYRNYKIYSVGSQFKIYNPAGESLGLYTTIINARAGIDGDLYVFIPPVQTLTISNLLTTDQGSGNVMVEWHQNIVGDIVIKLDNTVVKTLKIGIPGNQQVKLTNVSMNMEHTICVNYDCRKIATSSQPRQIFLYCDKTEINIGTSVMFTGQWLPLEEIKIHAVSDVYGISPTATTKTDSSGNFKVSGTPGIIPGTYQYEARSGLYKSNPVTIKLLAESGCSKNWKCEEPFNGYEFDGCGHRQLNTNCTPVLIPKEPPEDEEKDEEKPVDNTMLYIMVVGIIILLIIIRR